MAIHYQTTQFFELPQLQQLFLSVGWSSGDYPEKLLAAMANADRVISAWDGKLLVGLMHAISDGVMTAYFHYLLVHPRYQSQGVGKKLVAIMLDHYKDCACKVLISYDKEAQFYEKCGFCVGTDKTPLFVTDLKT